MLVNNAVQSDNPLSLLEAVCTNRNVNNLFFPKILLQSFLFKCINALIKDPQNCPKSIHTFINSRSMNLIIRSINGSSDVNKVNKIKETMLHLIQIHLSSHLDEFKQKCSSMEILCIIFVPRHIIKTKKQLNQIEKDLWNCINVFASIKYEHLDHLYLGGFYNFNSFLKFVNQIYFGKESFIDPRNMIRAFDNFVSLIHQ